MSNLTYKIITTNEEVSLNDKANAQSLTRMLSDANVSFKIEVSAGSKKCLFSGLNAWAEIKELTGC